jgi:hypothetical protein
MKEKESSEQFPEEWIDLFSDPDQLLKGDWILLRKEYPPPLRLALSLEFYLTAGEEPLKELWGRLPLEELKVLRIEILKCYLFQPLFIRLFPQEKPRNPNPPLFLKRRGNLLFAERGTGSGREVGFYYPLAHHRLWPGLLSMNQNEKFSFEKCIKNLEPELTTAASSRMETLRQRADILRSLFLRERDGDVLFSVEPDQPDRKEKTEDVILEDKPAQDPGEVRFSEGDKNAHSPASGPDLSPAQSAKPQKKKKKKPAADQMDLFG